MSGRSNGDPRALAVGHRRGGPATSPDQPDFSAEAVAAARAFSYRHHRGPGRNPDHLAFHFLGPPYRVAYRIGPVGRLVHAMWQRKIPGIAAFLNARTHHIDAVVRHAVTAGTPQVVILGAGYDTRAWRLDTALAGVAVYEVDRPATQARKRSIAARRLGGTPENIRYVEVDFRLQRSAFPALQRAGYEPAKPALFVWEGVSYYLPAADVDALLEDLATRAAPGSAVVFDYLYAEVLTGDCGLHGAEAARQFLQRRGQPYLFGIPRGGLARYLSARGLALVHDLSPEQLWAAYLRGGPGRPEDLFGGYGMALGRATGTTR